MEVGPDAVHGPWERDASDQQHKQHYVGHSGCDVHHLDTHRDMEFYIDTRKVSIQMYIRSKG